MSTVSPWRTLLLSIREEFQRWADKEPKLRHLVIQPLTRGMKMPEFMAAHLSADLNVVQKCDVWDWREELPEIAYLYGPLPEVKAFRSLAERAWRALPLDGSTCLTCDGQPSDDWLHFVYLTLGKYLPSYFCAVRKLHLVSGFAKGVFGKEVTYAFTPDREAEAENFSESSQRYRLTSLHVDPFTASVAAIEVIQTCSDVQAILGWQPQESGPDSAEPASRGEAGRGLDFVPGAIIYRGHRERLPGKPWKVLKALAEARDKTLTLSDLQDDIWSESASGQDAVRSAVSTARNAVRKVMQAAGVSGPEDPIPAVDRGTKSTAWQLLELP
jgi:hypothetical protein